MLDTKEQIKIEIEAAKNGTISYGGIAFLAEHRNEIKELYPDDAQAWEVAGIPENEWNQRGEKMINVNEKIEELKHNLPDIVFELCGSQGDLSSRIAEIADNESCLSWKQAMEWLEKPHSETYVEDAVREGFVDMKNFDLLKAIAAGSYLYNERELYKNQDAGLLLFVYDYIKSRGHDEITEEQDHEIESENWDFMDTFEDMRKKADEILKNNETEE